MTTAAYPGSFDPLTWGHIRLIEQAASVFPQLTVAVGVNRNKKYLFTISERLHLARQTLAHLPNVKVVAFEGLLTRFLAEQDIRVVIRGLRSGKDMDENFLQDFFAWRQHEGLNVTPFYIPSKPAEAFLSSSLLKQALQEQADTAEMAPLASSHAVQARMLGQFILGVTGLSGSGKTHVCQQLMKLAQAENIQAHHIDADKLVHAIYEACPEPLYTRTRIEIAHQMQSHYGANVLQPNSTHINRKKLAEVVFANPAAKTFLEDTLYGPLTVLLRQTLRGKKGLILVDAPTLAEAGWLPIVNNNVLLVSAS
ncbi:MAG: pantetheine-phosphate adenylyltransferase, partial [Proteobacteria bacterium]|nr:pantetheine-phosphate adenylyltransferase [Pseudomonadota bacterium]